MCPTFALKPSRHHVAFSGDGKERLDQPNQAACNRCAQNSQKQASAPGCYGKAYPFLESLLEDKQHPLLFLSSMCLDNHNEPFISSQIYSDTDYIKYQLNRRIV